MATQAEIESVWRMLRASYPHFAGSKSAEELSDTFLVYEELLRDLPGDVLRAATVQHVSACKWFPTVAELR